MGDSSTAGMKGEGYYDAHSEYQRRVIEGGDALIREAAGSLAAPEGRALTIVDYGAGTGATSVHAVGTAIASVRKGSPGVEIRAVHNDVVGNDFRQLFLNVAGDDGYLGDTGGAVYAEAAAGSFFERVVPSGSVDLGMCSNAAHWLRRQPEGVSIPNGMYFCEAPASPREALARQAAGDWLEFLRARAAELVPRGRLIVQGIATTDDGRTSASKLLREMWRAARALEAEGLLDPAALGTYVFPVYCRTEEEARAPLGPGAPLEGEIELVAARVEEVANPYWEFFERNGDPAAYARAYVEFVRAFAESTLMEHLFEPAARQAEPAALCDEYFDRLRRMTEEDPEAGRYECWILRLDFRRR
jgi:cyclopropane-fatty-acyl-phospholipid synthase